MIGLSVIIPSFNTKEMTIRCIESIEKALKEDNIPHEILVVDNNSSDGSPEALLAKESDSIKVIQNKENVGYGKANNQALRIAQHKYVLLLNSDAIVEERIDFKRLLGQFEVDPHLGALTVRVNLADGKLDKASHRGFPTLWRSFCYFLGLEKLFGNIPVFDRIFGGYHMTYQDLKTPHEIDSPTGAFYLSPRHLLRELKGFDEDFFMYGEDLDLSYRIKEKGYRIIFDPTYRVTHYKYQSGLQNGKNKDVRKKIRHYFYDAMKIFYRKHYASQYPQVINNLVYLIINLKSR